MKKKPTVTIGIPAFNEAANIKQLLLSVLSQKQNKFRLERIIIVSDASEDTTDVLVKDINDKRVELLRNKKRIGKALSQNIILNKLKSDFLVILDADVLPKNSLLIENIIKPLLEDNKVGLVGGKVNSLHPESSLEKILLFSRQTKLKIFEKLNNGNNLFLCHGSARAFSKVFAKQLKWPATSGEDAFSYLSCLKYGYVFRYEPKAEVYNRLPRRFKGHFNQSVRFLGARKRMKEFFEAEFVENNYSIPKKLTLKIAIPEFLRNPLVGFLYALIYTYAVFLSHVVNKSKALWDISNSSKRLFQKI